MSNRITWSTVVGLISFVVTFVVFMVEIVVVSLCEFILTGRIGVFVDDGFFNTGGRICTAIALLAFVVGFIIAFRKTDG